MLRPQLVATPALPLTVVESATGFGPGFSTTAVGGLRPDNADEGWQGSVANVFFYQTVLTLEELTTIRDGGAEAILPRPPQGPQITNIERTGNVTIRWNSAAGATYIVEYTDSLVTAWTQVATMAGQGATTSYTDSDPVRMARPVGFYRVGAQP